MTKPFLRCFVLAACLFWGAPQARAEPPRLAVLVVVDQLSRELFDRSEPLFSEEGFRRLTKQGADFAQCHHDHFITTTAPGHASLATGAYPVHHGIVNNHWFSRRHGRARASVEDSEFKLVPKPERPSNSSSAPGASPRSLEAPTIGDALRGATGMRAKVVSISIKDRSAVLLGGWRPNAAYWFDPERCWFVTSSYYVDDVPKWASDFNGRNPCATYLPQRWTRLLGADSYTRLAHADDVPWERNPFALGRTFPHSLKEQIEANAETSPYRYSAVVISPFGNDLLLDFAKAAIEGEQLGRDSDPDLLALSLSTNDYVGHFYGPNSQEVLDLTLRTDRWLANLMRSLDEKVGKGRWLLVVTSDHATAPAPEYLEALGLLSTREEHHRFDVHKARDQIEAQLAKHLFGGKPPKGFPGFLDAWGFDTMPFVYMQREPPRTGREAMTVDGFADVVAAEIEKLDGVARVFRRTERPALAASLDSIEAAAYRSWHDGNGGDLLIQLDPHWIVSDGRAAANHGSPYRYDTHVPLLLYGRGIRAGRYERPVEAIDLASTLARLLRIGRPARDQGEPLLEALAD